MYISKIHIQNYRNFGDFTMEFHKGLNVIIGANNSGKTGLLHAINLLNSPSDISVNDFNKNLLLQYSKLYSDAAPSIIIEYNICHRMHHPRRSSLRKRYESSTQWRRPVTLF